MIILFQFPSVSHQDFKVCILYTILKNIFFLQVAYMTGTGAVIIIFIFIFLLQRSKQP